MGLVSDTNKCMCIIIIIIIIIIIYFGAVVSVIRNHDLAFANIHT